MTTSTLADRAKMSVSGTPGTGQITLNSAVAGFQTFAAAGIVDGDTVSYVIEDASNTWEVGQGTYTTSGGNKLTRSPSASSNSGSAISATSAAVVYLTARAADLNALGGGGGSSTRTLINTITVSSAQASIVDTTSITSTYNDYEIVIERLVPATSTVALNMVFYVGGSADNASGDYNSSVSYTVNGSNGADGAYATHFELAAGNIGTSSAGVSGSFRLFNANNVGSAGAMLNGLCNYLYYSNNTSCVISYGGGHFGGGIVDGLALSFSSGNISSGTVRIYGLT